MNTNIDYRKTVKTVDLFTLGIARDILATPDTLPEAREYAEYLLTLPIRKDGHGAGFNAEPEVKARRTGGGTTATSSKPANPADLIGATVPQIKAIIKLGALKEHVGVTFRHLTVDISVSDVVARATEGGFVTKGEAGKTMDYLVNAPWKPRAAAPKPVSAPQTARKAPVTQDGMYHLGDRIVKVQKSRQGDRLYAKALLGNKEEGFHFEYAPGLVGKLAAEDRMSLEEAKEFGALYNWCCVCSTRLTKEASIAAGIGPICAGKL